MVELALFLRQWDASLVACGAACCRAEHALLTRERGAGDRADVWAAGSVATVARLGQSRTSEPKIVFLLSML